MPPVCQSALPADSCVSCMRLLLVMCGSGETISANREIVLACDKSRYQ